MSVTGSRGADVSITARQVVNTGYIKQHARLKHRVRALLLEAEAHVPGLVISSRIVALTWSLPSRACIKIVQKCCAISSMTTLVAQAKLSPRRLRPVSSKTSRAAQSSKLSPYSRCPPGTAKSPAP